MIRGIWGLREGKLQARDGGVVVWLVSKSPDSSNTLNATADAKQSNGSSPLSRSSSTPSDAYDVQELGS
ncbi:hypothetical protein cyc_05765 [Cyclospora cayetanensis]|uniref:Uncharacterized protein n=1 Tax=Cyclospora cayetanensis TaxID=88456 RepID=A0A1D3D106_9EIME|nr:hypothetical protein cyc_05765 [Cyclospora cayetanensis]